jgi:hypothetical protein
MVGNYKKKTDIGSHISEIINAALVAVREGLSVRKASLNFNIPRITYRPVGFIGLPVFCH